MVSPTQLFPLIRRKLLNVAHEQTNYSRVERAVESRIGTSALNTVLELSGEVLALTGVDVLEGALTTEERLSASEEAFVVGSSKVDWSCELSSLELIIR